MSKYLGTEQVRITVVPECKEIQFSPESMTKKWQSHWLRFLFDFPFTLLVVFGSRVLILKFWKFNWVLNWFKMVQCTKCTLVHVSMVHL